MTQDESSGDAALSPPSSDAAADAMPSADAAPSVDATTTGSDATIGQDAGANDGSIAVLDGASSQEDAGSAEGGSVRDATDGADCAGDFNVTCAQGAACPCTNACSVSEGMGPGSCDLTCTCDDAGVFQCGQDCPPDAAPPTDCNQGVMCAPGVECGGDPPVCLCDNTGHLQCPPGWDGGAH